MAAAMVKVSYIVKSEMKADPDYGFLVDRSRVFGSVAEAHDFCMRLPFIEKGVKIIGKPCLEDA